MRVLVTGGGGYLGSVLVRRLLDRGHNVRLLDRLYWGTAPIEEIRPRIELVHGDIRETDDAWFDGVDAVIHLAGLSNDPTANFDPEANWEMNAQATAGLGLACKRAAIKRFVFASSCSLYDGLPDGSTYDESAPIEPRGPYAESKRFGEEALLGLAGGSFAPVILRLGTVFGLSPRMRFDLVVNTFVKDALSRGRLVLHGGGWMSRPLVDVRDAADAFITCTEAPEADVAAQVFNVVEANYTVRDVATIVASALALRGREIALTEAPAPPLVRNYACSNAKLCQTLGLRLTRNVANAVDEMLDAFAEADLTKLGHPRYYNLEWMVLLKEIINTHRPFDYVLRRGETTPGE